MNPDQLIDQLIKDAQALKSEVESFSHLSEEELNYKPGPDVWSALECIEHMNIADAHYLFQFEQKLKSGTPSSGRPFKSGLLGNLFVKGIKPKEDGSIPNRMKTFQKLRPTVTALYDTTNRFLEDQDRMIHCLEKSRALELNKNKVPTFLGRLVPLNLGDAYRFVIAHNQRHIQQIKNTLKEYPTTPA